MGTMNESANIHVTSVGDILTQDPNGISNMYGQVTKYKLLTTVGLADPRYSDYKKQMACERARLHARALIDDGYIEAISLPKLQTHIITYDATKFREYYKLIDDRRDTVSKVYRDFAPDGTELFSLEGYMPYKPYKKYVRLLGCAPYKELSQLELALDLAEITIDNLAIGAIGNWNVCGIAHISNHQIIVTPESLENQCLDMANNSSLSETERILLSCSFNDAFFRGFSTVGGSVSDGIVLAKKYNLTSVAFRG